MDELRILTREERKAAYDTVFREAFPASELKPLASMERMIAEGSYRFYGLFRGGAAVCYACCWEREGWVLLDYLCVPRDRRCGGIGGDMIRLLTARYPADTVILAETEAETGETARDEMILRRQGFYRRLGAVFLPFDSALFGVHYRVIAWSRRDLTAEETLRNYDAFYRRAFAPELYAAAVQIPLAPGEQPYPAQKWQERADED